MNILLVGINGRMGQEILKLAEEKFDNEINIVAGIDKVETCEKYKKNNKKIEIFGEFSNIYQNLIEKIDIVLDFSSPKIIQEELMFCKKYNKKLIVCSTGHSEENIKLIKKYSGYIPIFLSPNTSMGVAFLVSILKSYIKFIKNYEIKIIETHHKNKKDTPSGTAKSFIDELKSHYLNAEVISLRGGNCPGEHEIVLLGQNEKISIKHEAYSRELFAEGALKIAEFMKDKKAGLYTMELLL